MSNLLTAANPDGELLQRFREEDDQRAFGILVERYQMMVMGAALRRTGDREMAREVAQEVFAALARKAALLADRATIGGWLHQAAVYQGARALHSEKRRRLRQERYWEETQVETPRQQPPPETAGVDQALDSLSPSDREALVLHYLQDLSYPEMAGLLGIAEPAIRQRVSRALQRLAKILHDRGIPGNATVLLLSAMAIQSSIAAPAGLAASALAAAAAGSGSSAYLALTALLSHTGVKKLAMVIGAAGVALLWYEQPSPIYPSSTAATQQSAEETRVDVPPSSIEPTGSPPAPNSLAPSLPGVATSATLASGGVRSVAVPVGSSAGPPAERQLQLSAPGGEVIDPAPPVPAQALDSTLAQTAPTQPPAAPLPGSAPSEGAGARFFDPDYRFPPGPLGAAEELGGLPAVAEELLRAELVPTLAAELYSTLLGEILPLQDFEHLTLEGVLQDHFERLQEDGVAGLRPLDVAPQVWGDLRADAVDRAAEEVAQTLPEAVAAAPEAVEEVLTLADTILPPAEQPVIPEEPATPEAEAVAPQIQQTVQGTLEGTEAAVTGILGR